MAVGDPQLAAVEDVSVALSVGAQSHRDDIRAGAGLTHRQCADMLAGDQLWQILALLSFGAVAADLIDAKIGMRTIREPDRSRPPAQLFHRDAMGEIAHAGAAIFFLNGDPVQSERTHFGPQLDWKTVGPVDFGR